MSGVIKVGNKLWCRYTEQPLNKDVYSVTISHIEEKKFTVVQPGLYAKFEINIGTMKTDDGSIEATFNLNTWNEEDSQKELIKMITDIVELGGLGSKTSDQLVRIMDILSEQ